MTRALSVAVGNSTDASFTGQTPTGTKPGGAGVFDLKAMKETLPRFLDLQFFGQGTDDQVFNCRITGWKPHGDVDGFTTAWYPRTLAEFACTLSTATGIAGGQVTATDKMVDALSLTTGNNNVDVEFVSPADNTPAQAMLDLKGSHLVQFTFTKGNATNGNALFTIL